MLKIAVVTYAVVGAPRAGSEMRLKQTLSLAQRIASGNVVVWDLLRQQPLCAALRCERRVAVASDSRKSTLRRLVRDLFAVCLHVLPKFSISFLGVQRMRILEWLAQEHPTHIIVTHPGATELLRDHRVLGSAVYVDTQNVESDLARQLVRLARGPAEAVGALLYFLAVRQREQQYFRAAKEVWVPSEADAARLLRLYGRSTRARVVPNAIDLRRYQMHSFEPSHTIVFAGDFGYRPNVAAAEVLAREILPEVAREISDARLLLVGRDPHGWAAALQRGSSVLSTGEVEDVQPLLRKGSVVTVPIRQGGGTRFKILEALALGLPVVTTPLGCEGLDVVDGEHLLIRRVEDFPRAIVSLFRDSRAAEQLGRTGRMLIERKYSWSAAEEVMREALLGNVPRSCN